MRNKPLSDIEIEEALAKQALNRSMFHRLLPLLRPVRKQIAIVVLVEILLVGVVFLRPWFVKELIDHGLTPHAAAGNWTAVVGVAWCRFGAELDCPLCLRRLLAVRGRLGRDHRAQ